MGKILIAVVALMLAAMTAPAFADDGGVKLSATLTGAAEVPGPGDPDASGTAALRLNAGQGEVCFQLAWSNIDGTVTASHIHVGPSGVAGPIVVPLFVGASFSGTGSASGCVTDVDRDLIVAIIQDPAGYYVNIHSSVFPAGAIRGQLSK
jgi:hypothetical protein